MSDFQLHCPRPVRSDEHILMGHGGGGRLMNQLIQDLIRPNLGVSDNEPPHDAAVFEITGTRLAFTTDSYVVQPIFFPGGDIGQLAVHGTVNDLSMAGARPQYISLGLILEEGFPMTDLDAITRSIGSTAASLGVQVVTGDTKVIERGKGTQIYINTAGIGVIGHRLTISPQAVRPGDAVILSGDIGRHGMAIMAVREGLEFESEITSDSAPLWECVEALLEAGIKVHCLRDLTRGGLASAGNEIAATGGYGIRLEEARIPVREDVRAACEILGLDPIYVANEGRFIAFVPEEQAGEAVAILRKTTHGQDASRIGSVVNDPDHLVTLKGALGQDRIIDMLTADQLPRIC